MKNLLGRISKSFSSERLAQNLLLTSQFVLLASVAVGCMVFGLSGMAVDNVWEPVLVNSGQSPTKTISHLVGILASVGIFFFGYRILDKGISSIETKRQTDKALTRVLTFAEVVLDRFAPEQDVATPTAKAGDNLTPTEYS